MVTRISQAFDRHDRAASLTNMDPDYEVRPVGDLARADVVQQSGASLEVLRRGRRAFQHLPVEDTELSMPRATTSSVH